MNKLLIIALCGLAFICSSCGDDGESPKITIQTPSDGATFTAGDILRLDVNVTDDVDIASIIISSDGFFTADPVTGLEGSEDRSFTVTSELTIEDTTPTGDFVIDATATDNDGNSTKESVAVTIE